MFNRQSIHIAMLLWGSIFSLIAAVCMIINKNFDKNKRIFMICMQISCTILLLSDAFAWGFRGTNGISGYYMVRISNFLVFLFSDILLFIFHGYTCCCLFEDRRKNEMPIVAIKLGYIIPIIGAILVIISQFTNLYYYFDSKNIYHRNTEYILSLMIPMIGMIVDFILILKNKRNVEKEIFVSLLSYITLPFLAAIALLFYYGASLINIAISISMVLMFVSVMIEQNRKIAIKEKEATNLKIDIMMSQIAPHFIFNTITTIQRLCDVNPKEASETLGEFATYLRGNIDSLSKNKRIPFTQELEHVRCYLAIEKKRFGNRVNVEYNIKYENFMIPALTLQPLVENAVKHGLCKKENGGTVYIETEYRKGNIYIIVKDDGIGFKVNISQNTTNHVGLKNVSDRLDEMCKGTLYIESEIGKGTKVVVKIPQNKE